MALSGPIKTGGGNTTSTQTVVTYTGGGGSGGGGGYTVKNPVTPAEEINAQLANAGDIYKNEVATANKGAKDALDNIKKQREANAQQLLMKNAQINRKSEWQPQQQKEQSVLNNMRRTMGNAAYGSAMQDLQEGLSRYDDMSDVALINTWKDNTDEAYNSWYQANADLINDYNEQVIRAQNTLDTAYNNYLNNLAGVDARLGREAYKSSNTGKEISRKEDDQTYKTTVLKKDTAIDNLLKMLTNKAINYDKDGNITYNGNPNIPNGTKTPTYSEGGEIDYIRPNNAVAEARNSNLGNVGNVNTSAGAYAPTKSNISKNNIDAWLRKTTQNFKFPGYNYQRENFAGYKPRV